MECSVLEEAVFCPGEKQGVVINDECGWWCNGVGDFLPSVWDSGKTILHEEGSGRVGSRINPAPECEVDGIDCHDG